MPLQEDAHSVVLDLDSAKSGFFGVFDGHGGKEVAKFSALYLVRGLLPHLPLTWDNLVLCDSAFQV